MESLTSLLYYFNNLPKSRYLSNIFPLDYFYKIALNYGSLLLQRFQYLPRPCAILITFDKDLLILVFNTKYCLQLFQALTKSCLLPHVFILLTTDLIFLVSFSLFCVKYYLIYYGSNPYFTKLFVVAFISVYPSLVIVSAAFLI